MILYGVTIDLQVVPVRLGSQQMMECRDVFNSEKEAKARAEELRALCAAAPGNSAQHSVPEEFIGRLSEFLAQRGATGKALLRELRDMLAAAPGKEVGHE
ncbi:TPA: hypothetical protein ACXJAB_000993 [Pseudomonas aeruginosa]